MAKVTVYKITNIKTGKPYIGITRKTLDERWQGHIREAKRLSKRQVLAFAIQKYGPRSFTIEAIAEAATWEEAQELERHYIEKHQSHINHGNGYNMTLGGEGSLGRVLPNAGEKVDQSMHLKLTQAERDILSILARAYKMPMNIVIRRLIVQAAIDKVQDNEVFALISASDAGQ